MKKLSLVFLFALFLVLVNCSEDSKSINQPVVDNLNSLANLYIAMQLNEPEIMNKPVTYGELSEGKTETFTNIVYVGPYKSVYYQFKKIDGLWTKNDYERIIYHDKRKLSKTTTDTPYLAELWQSNNYAGPLGMKLKIENLENITQTDYYWSTVYDGTVGSAEYINPSDITIGWDKWSFSYDKWEYEYQNWNPSNSWENPDPVASKYDPTPTISAKVLVKVTYTDLTPPPPTVSISSIGNNQYTATASSGSGTYTDYTWWYRNDNVIKSKDSKQPPTGVWIKNSSWDDDTTITYNPGFNFSLKCQVTDSNNQTAQNIYTSLVQ